MKSNSSPNIKIFLIGNKTDLEENRVVQREEAQQFKEDYELDYFIETSAKTGMNTQEIFIQAARLLYRDYIDYKKEKKEKEKEKEKEKIDKLNNDENERKKEKKGCC